MADEHEVLNMRFLEAMSYDPRNEIERGVSRTFHQGVQVVFQGALPVAR